MSRAEHEVAKIDRRIHQALTTAAERKGSFYEPATEETPASALIMAEEADDEEVSEIRREALARMLDFFFQSGAHPAAVMKNVYALTKILRPELILDMRCEDLAKLFGNTKAAWSWRLKQIFSATLKKAGAKGTSAGFQKSPAASDAYARAQRGNHNRRGRNYKAPR